MSVQAGDGEPGDLKLEDYLPYRLSIASNAVSGLISRAYQERFGLTIPQWRLICVLASVRRMTQAQLVSRTLMDKVTVSRAAQGLVARRVIERSDNLADGRSHVLSLSQEGRRLFGEVAPLALAYETALVSGLAPEEVRLLRRLLERLQTAATALAGEAHSPA